MQTTNLTQMKIGEKIYIDLPVALRSLRDLVHAKFTKILIDNKKVFAEIQNKIQQLIPEITTTIEYYTATIPIFSLYQIEEQLQKALYRKIYLKSGAYLIFDQTEAMTTIDVNTGSYVSGNDHEQAVYTINLEAVAIIAQQIRLRNLGGIIIVDFIDMEDLAHKQAIYTALQTVVAKDKVRTEVSEVSNLGLIQMTRKRTHKSLEHMLCIACPACHKRGTIKTHATMYYELCRELKRLMSLFSWPGFKIIATTSFVEYLLAENKVLLTELIHYLEKPVYLDIDTNFMPEQYSILPWQRSEISNEN